MVIWGYLGALAYGIVCLLFGTLAYKLGMPKKYTRKIVHILIGVEWFILYHTMGASLHFVAVCLIFTALIAVSYFKNLMPMISSDNDNAPGTVYYCISMTVMATVSYFVGDFVLPFGIAVLCTSVGDGFACVVGSAIRRHNPSIYKKKSLFGTLSAFVLSFVSVYVFSVAYQLPLGIAGALLVALLAAGMELVTEFGLDNISIPLTSAAFAYFLAFYPATYNYAVPIVATPFIIALALGRGILTKKAVVYAVICDVCVSVTLGNFGFVLLLSFLLLSVVVDKIKKRFKKTDDDVSARGDNRDEVQVIANGAVPVAMALLFWLSGEKAFVIGYCAALAECFADTCASGIGMTAKGAFDIFKMKPVKKGLSGGMSWQGTVASVIAPLMFATIAIAFGVLSIKELLIVSLSASLGAFFDSFLGSLAQSKFKCTECAEVTEKACHCGKPTELVSGLHGVNNDVVNVLSVAFTAIISVVAYAAIVF